MASKRNAKKAKLQQGKGAQTPQPLKVSVSFNKGPRSEPPAKKKTMMETEDNSEEEITFEATEATKLFAASDSDSEDMDSVAVPMEKVGQKRKSTQGSASVLIGKKSETPAKKTEPTKSPQQVQQMNGQKRTPAQKGKVQTPAKVNNQKSTPLTKGQTPMKKTPKGTPGQQKDLKQTPGLKQTPKSKPVIQAEDLSDDEDEEEEEDKEEEEIQHTVKGSNQKQISATKVQTPVQTLKKQPSSTPQQQNGQKQTPETSPKAGQKRKSSAATPVEDKKPKVAMGDSQVSGDAEENRRTLFVGNIMDQVSEEDLKKLSPDIIDVRLRFRAHKRKKQVKLMHFAYLVFKSEEIAEKNYKKLQNAKFKSSVLRVDYVGDKRQHGKEIERETETEFDRTRLYVSGLKPSTSELDVRKIFPTSSTISLPRHKITQQHYGFGFVQFANEALAKAAMEKVQGKLPVQFAKAKSKTQKKQLNPIKQEHDANAYDDDDSDDDLEDEDDSEDDYDDSDDDEEEDEDDDSEEDEEDEDEDDV